MSTVQNVNHNTKLIYARFGYNMWRDALKPTEILAGLCKNHKLQPPIYRDQSCFVADHKFHASTFIEREGGEHQ